MLSVGRVAPTNRSSLVLGRWVPVRRRKASVFHLDPCCLFSSPGKNPSCQHGSSINHRQQGKTLSFSVLAKKKFQLLCTSQSGAEPKLELDGAVIFLKLLQTPGRVCQKPARERRLEARQEKGKGNKIISTCQLFTSNLPNSTMLATSAPLCRSTQNTFHVTALQTSC
jgi:hypothetical protein